MAYAAEHAERLRGSGDQRHRAGRGGRQPAHHRAGRQPAGRVRDPRRGDGLPPRRCRRSSPGAAPRTSASWRSACCGADPTAGGRGRWTRSMPAAGRTVGSAGTTCPSGPCSSDCPVRRWSCGRGRLTCSPSHRPGGWRRRSRRGSWSRYRRVGPCAHAGGTGRSRALGRFLADAGCGRLRNARPAATCCEPAQSRASIVSGFALWLWSVIDRYTRPGDGSDLERESKYADVAPRGDGRLRSLRRRGRIPTDAMARIRGKARVDIASDPRHPGARQARDDRAPHEPRGAAGRGLAVRSHRPHHERRVGHRHRAPAAEMPPIS